MLKLTNVTVSYGYNTIYKDFNCEFQRGVNVVLGQSGSGKTTLLNVIARLVEYRGQCETDKVAIVFQTPSLASVSVLNNVEMVLKSKNSRSLAVEVLKLAQIDHLKDKRAILLSGGEQQRVSLARAFAADRPVLLLDEPFHSLDYGVKQKLYQTLNTLLQKYDKTVVLVTHDIDEALQLGDRIYFLQDKPAKLTQVAEIATPQGARDEYSTEMIELRKQLQQLMQG